MTLSLRGSPSPTSPTLPRLRASGSAVSLRTTTPLLVCWLLPPPPSRQVAQCQELTKCATELANKKAVIVAIPGAFTPTCSAAHLPSYIENKDKLKAKGVDQVIFLAHNDAFVMSGWGKANNVKDDYIVSLP